MSQDTSNCWIQITSGRGPAECGWVVARLAAHLARDAEATGLRMELLEAVPGDERGTLRSALLSVEGAGAEVWAAGWAGTVQWIGQSPFRPHHKRKNWFAGVTVLQPPERPDWNERELRIDVFRASGPGGQHVNKTESAVRVTHLPTGTVATAQEERSQARNKALALARLAEALDELGRGREEVARQQRWQEHNQLQRGEARHVFSGAEFKERRG